MCRSARPRAGHRARRPERSCGRARPARSSKSRSTSAARRAYRHSPGDHRPATPRWAMARRPVGSAGPQDRSSAHATRCIWVIRPDICRWNDPNWWAVGGAGRRRATIRLVPREGCDAGRFRSRGPGVCPTSGDHRETITWSARARQRCRPYARPWRGPPRRPAFKTRLFRFVDVVPACRGAADTAHHLAEYLATPDSPAAVRAGLRLTEHLPGGDRLAAGAATFGIRQMASQFIIGARDRRRDRTPRRRFGKSGFANTLDLLGEKTLTNADADSLRRRGSVEALAALDGGGRRSGRRARCSRRTHGVASPGQPVGEAVGPVGQGLQRLDGGRCCPAVDRLEPILEAAKRAGATIHLDAEHDETKDATHALLREIGRRFPDGPNLGCVVQAYRHDAADDLAGADPVVRRHLGRAAAGPAGQRRVLGRRDDRRPRQRMGQPAVRGQVPTPTPTTSDARRRWRPRPATSGRRSPATTSAASLTPLTAARSAGLADHAVEVQVLYGMAQPLHDAVRDLGFRTRVYAPMGDLIPGMAYLVRRLLENTANESFVRQRFTGRPPASSRSSATPPSGPTVHPPTDTEERAVPPSSHRDPSPIVPERASGRVAARAGASALRRGRARRRCDPGVPTCRS